MKNWGSYFNAGLFVGSLITLAFTTGVNYILGLAGVYMLCIWIIIELAKDLSTKLGKENK